ncbi:hypothetical protein P5E41_07240 [Clostridium perfringens]|uniref:Uncharacterized protein n=1 Tax=Clostridium perfringens TaxID=1502 RepID=A0A8H9QWD7_CLOPF|nr:hypothetical protein [Clostridium perfringens]MDU3018773.1 hypothetical protein [Clostridium perfringens]HAT4307393.1 hypothetical protein [Clostridium perfringens]
MNDFNKIENMIKESINFSNLLLVADVEKKIIGFIYEQRGMLKKLNIQLIWLLEFWKTTGEEDLEEGFF